MKRLIPQLLIILALPGTVVAETAYISDTLYVPLRSGPGNEFRIVNRALRTGTALTLVERDTQNGYYQVRTPSGQDGYVPEQYILLQPPAMLQLKTAQEQSDRLQTQINQLTTRLQAAETELQEKTTALANNTQASGSLQDELNRIKSIASKSLELDKRNRELVLTNEQLMGELQTLQTTNQNLEDTSAQRWYLYGAGTLFFGLLIGAIAPMLRPRKKSSGWT